MNYRFMTDAELVRFVDSTQEATALERLLANRLAVRLAKETAVTVKQKEETNVQQQAFEF